HAPRHAHDPDDRTPELSTAVSGSHRRPSRLDRRRCRSALIRQAAWLRRHSRCFGVAGNHYQKCRDPDRSNRSRKKPGSGCLAMRRRGQRSSLSPDHVDSRVHGPRLDPDCPDRILGTDGLCNHGGLAGSNHPHPGLPTNAVCNLVSRQGRAVVHHLTKMLLVRVLLRRALGFTRYVMFVSVIAALAASVALILYQAAVVAEVIIEAVRTGGLLPKAGKTLAVGLIEAMDVFLIAIVALVIGLGLHRLFVDKRCRCRAGLRSTISRISKDILSASSSRCLRS